MRTAMFVIGMGTAILANANRDPAETAVEGAAERNGDSALRRWLSNGGLADQFSRDGTTALIREARAGNLDAMHLLLDAGADPNLRDRRSTGWPPLMHAIHERQSGAVRVLLDRGADPNDRMPRGRTPLIMAAADGDPTIVKLLLERGADARAMTDEGDTALTQAVSGGALSDIDRPLLGGCYPKTVQALLDHDPDLRLPQNFAGRIARVWARLRQCDEVLNRIR